jgi:hypothetical protein
MKIELIAIEDIKKGNLVIISRKKYCRKAKWFEIPFHFPLATRKDIKKGETFTLTDIY